MTLAHMGSALSESGLGVKFGPCTNALLGKVASTKMPAGSSVASLRQYLESKWGFKQGLQDHALLRAISQQPASRLANEGQMTSFLDDIAGLVLKVVGIDPANLPSLRAQSAGSASHAISSEALQSLQNEQKARDKRLLELYAKRCGLDLNASKAILDKQKTIDDLQNKVDAWTNEHGEAYEKGIQPMFDALKARTYDSYWNWVVQDLVVTFSDLVQGKSVDTLYQFSRFQTRMTPRLLDVIAYLLKALTNFPEGPHRDTAKIWLETLQNACSNLKENTPLFKYFVQSTVPILNIDNAGKVSVEEVPRDFSFQLESAMSLPDPKQALPLHIQTTNHASGVSRTCTAAPSTVFSNAGGINVTRSASVTSSRTSMDSDSPLRTTPAIGFDRVPIPPFSFMSPHSGTGLSDMPSLKMKGPGGFVRDGFLTQEYLRWFQTAASTGINFSDIKILITGAGRNSIGVEIVRQLLSAGANVLVTTSSYSPDTLSFYENLYRSHGARGSRLVVVPFNGGSHQDTENLVKYIYGVLGWDLDHVIPFAAVGEAGRDVSSIDAKSELAHRIMLTNLLRLLGAVKNAKSSRHIDTHPTHVVLPLSPNHGIFGNDGLYAESKIGLEALLNKWSSEDWSDYLSVCGAVIGWTRGTGLMHGNDILATGIEKELMVRTFRQAELAWHIVGLMDASVRESCELGPVMADLSGGLRSDMNLKSVLDGINEGITKQSDMRKKLAREATLEEGKPTKAPTATAPKMSKRARIQVDDSCLPSWEEIKPLHEQLEGMVNLDRVVVVTGFAEAGKPLLHALSLPVSLYLINSVGPCGSARTRWEAETVGTFSISGCVELAWIMGLVKYHNAPIQGKDYCGWLDVETGNPITDADIKTKYETYMVAHTGIRVIERQEHDLTQPNETQVLHEVSVMEDLEPFEVSIETAEDFKREHGENVTVIPSEDGQRAMITLRKGTTLMIPKAAQFKNAIGAQMPTGWDAKRYGIPDDIVAQVDPVTLYALISTVEAFLSAGITDPYELYNHMHVSDLGNAIGASLGGLRSLHEMFKKRFLDRQVQSDILAETFVNTTSAWINMLLLGASGPIRTPVGACATSLESVDTGHDLIMNGKAKAVLVGGTDYLERDIAAEFAKMEATVDAEKDAASGRTPKQGSRPTASSRAGFVEGEGCGIQLLTTARLALDMGLPIHGIIALTHTAADGIGRSVPAPGKGVLTAAAEKPQDIAEGSSRGTGLRLKLSSRRRQLQRRKQQIEENKAAELSWLDDGLFSQGRGSATSIFTPISSSSPSAGAYAAHLRMQIENDAVRALKEAQNTYGNDFFRHSNGAVAPLRGALAVWGLDIDDLSVASLHGTSTQKNDINETAVIEGQLARLGRTAGNVLPCVAQKGLIGHGKGAAGEFHSHVPTSLTCEMRMLTYA
jgi:fatty acid synthase subunit alpha